MTVTMVFFARAREIVGQPTIQLALPENATLFDAKQASLVKHAELAELFEHCTFSVDKEYSSDETVLTDGCEVGCIPPVSGG